MNTASSMLLLLLIFFVGYTIGLLKDKRETFDSGVELGKKIADFDFDKEEPQ